MSAWLSISCASPPRVMGWSSTKKILALVMIEWKEANHNGASAGVCRNSKRATNRCGPMPHDIQPAAPPRSCAGNSSSIVFDGETAGGVGGLQADVDPLRAGVLDGVVYRFLSDSEQMVGRAGIRYPHQRGI